MDKKTLTTTGLTVLALIAFAANSIFYRLALREPTIDPASYTAVRLVSGALSLWVVAGLLRDTTAVKPAAGGVRRRCCACMPSPFLLRISV